MFDELAERSLMSPLAGTKHTYVRLAIIIHCKLTILARKKDKFRVFMEQSTPQKTFIHEIQSAGFAAIHSRAVACFVFSVERRRKAGSDKNLASKIQNVCGIFITESDSLSTLICRKREGLVSKASEFRQRSQFCKSREMEQKCYKRILKSVDGPARLLQFAMKRLLSFYSLAFTRVYFRDFPLRYDRRGGSLKIFLSCGWFCIKCHVPILF